MKKKLSIVLAIVLMFSVFTPIHAEASSPQQYEEAGNILQDLKVLSGNAKGDLMLGNRLNRQDMVVLISRLYNEEDTAKSFVGTNKFSDLTINERYYIPYIAWAVDKGLITGKGNNKFGFGEEVTVQQFQTVLLRALGYEKDAENWDAVPALAKNFNIMDDLDLNPGQALTRGQMSVMTINTLRQEKNGRIITLADELGIKIPEMFKVESSVEVDNNNLIFTGQAKGADNLWISLKPASSNITSEIITQQVPTDNQGNFSYRIENLEVGNYHYRFQSGAKYTAYQAVTITVLPFTLVNVKASNLKEITLTFTQPLDRTITSMINNYNTTAGGIKEVRFADQDKEVTLVLNSTMVQQMKYKISALKIKSASGKELQLKDEEFEAMDIEIPKVLDIKQLGTKGIRLYLSEPVKSATSINFKVDGKNFPGNVTLDYDTITLLYFSSDYALSEGNHSLIISELEDFSGYRIVNETIPFVISKDTTPPQIVSASATMEEVIIEFNEDIDPATGLIHNFYWKSGSLKRYANKVTFSGSKAIVDFTNNRLPTSDTTIYVENVTDYSNNKIISGQVNVIPVIDLTNPEVINYIVAEDGKSIMVYYSKNVMGNNRSNYIITDQNNKAITIRDIEGSGNEFKINLYSPLPVGLNILRINGIQDRTPLKNQLLEFTTTIIREDLEKPKISNHTGYGNNVVIHFTKEMDRSIITNINNYYMTFAGTQYRLPDNTLLTPGNDGKSLTMLLPESFNGKKIMIGTVGNLTSLDLIGLRDIVGNDTDPLILNITFDATASGKAKAIAYSSSSSGKQGVLLESNLIKIRFNMPIVQVNKNDLAITGRTIISAIANGTDEVILYLNEINVTSLPTNLITILPNNNMKTSIDTGVESGSITILDRIPPRIKDNVEYLAVYNTNQIHIPFTEPLEEEGASLYRYDLEIIRLADGKILNKEDYTTSLPLTDKSTLVVTINKRDIKSKYSIRLNNNLNPDSLIYIRDKDSNWALPTHVYETSIEIN